MPIEMTGEYTKRRSKPIDSLLGRDVWLLSVLIDAAGTSNCALEDAWDQPLVKSALLGQRKLTPTRTDRQLTEFGIGDRHGLFMAAGLSERQRQVMEARYPDDIAGRETPSPSDIAEKLGWPSLRVRVHLHEGYDRLRKWARQQEQPLTISL